MEILIGTHNQNKFSQFQRAFAQLGNKIKLLSLNDVKIKDEVEEDSDSLMVNARKKAQFYGEKSGLPTLADDLGLFIDALGGEPGVHAKRWLEGTDKDRYLKILEKMKDVPEAKRTCSYKSVLAFYDPQKKGFWTYQQSLDGFIAREPKEGRGFGYDPIVFINGKYYSEYSDEERYQVSHRGLGSRELLKHLGFMIR